ncbi:hypothetical protein BOO30_16540 [Vibrio navarrensis]|nr:hypothetical protein [Vibrio navarrensis]MBE4579065.1 hypothetical protein [Vibrio navarrensis]MBE4597977.1 hypothetical protein [Vibrio navarrensis]
MINNIYGGLLSILWRTAQIVFWGGREEEKVLGSGPLVLGKQERKKEARLLGTRFLGRARAEEKVLWSWGPGESGREGTSFLEARLRGKAKAEKQDLEKQDRSSRFSCSSWNPANLGTRTALNRFSPFPCPSPLFLEPST